MKRFVSVCISLIMVCMLATSAFAAVSCVRDGCIGGLVDVYCAGYDKTYSDTHTFHTPVWPLGKTECTYYVESHHSSGLCRNCGYSYASGAGLVADHAGDFGHLSDCPSYPGQQLSCSSGDLLSWYM